MRVCVNLFFSLWISCLVLAKSLYCHGTNGDFTVSLSKGPEDEHLDLISINGRDFLSNITKDISGKPWDDGREPKYTIRYLRQTKCERLQNNTCFGGKIPYKFTSGQLSEEGNQEQNIKKLKQLEALRNVPKCWEVIQVNLDFSYNLCVYIILNHLK